MKFIIALVAIIGIVSAGCTYTTVTVTTQEEYNKAVNNTKPGTIINVQASSILSINLKNVHGDLDCPVTIACYRYGKCWVFSDSNLTGSSYVTIANFTMGNNIEVYGKYITFDSVLFSTDTIFYVHDADHITVRNSTLTSTFGNGFIFKATTNSVVERNIFEAQTVTYISLDKKSCNNVITGNIFYDVFKEGHRPWIEIKNQSNSNVISRNSFIYVEDISKKYGIVASESSYNMVKENIFMLGDDMYAFHAEGNGADTNRACNSNKCNYGYITDGKIDYSC